MSRDSPVKKGDTRPCLPEQLSSGTTLSCPKHSLTHKTFYYCLTESLQGAQEHSDSRCGTRKINSRLSAPPPSQHSGPSLRSTGWVGEGGVDAAFTGHSAPRLPAIFFSPPSTGRWVLPAASSPPPESVPPAQKGITLAAQVCTGMPEGEIPRYNKKHVSRVPFPTLNTSATLIKPSPSSEAPPVECFLN